MPPQGGRKHPQQEFLQVDTKDILFVCGGAFAGVDKIIAARGRGTTIGFGADIKDLEEKDVGEFLKDLLPDDLVKYGLIPEFVGRLPMIATLENLDEEALITILTEPKNALVKQFQKLFDIEGAHLNFTDDALKAIAQQAIERKTGARGLRSIMEGLLLDTMYELPDAEDVAEVLVTDKTVNEDEAPKFVKGKKKKATKPKAKPKAKESDDDKDGEDKKTAK